MERRRGYLEVIADILRLRQASSTQILYGANISGSLLRKYLDLLTEGGFVTWVDEEGAYRTTEKGFRLLEMIDRLLAELEPDTTGTS